MMMLAGLLLIAAMVAGYWGLSMSRQPVVATSIPSDETPSEIPPSSAPGVLESVRQQLDPSEPVVVLTREVPARAELSRDDLAVEHLSISPPDSFTDPEELVGRRVWRTLPAGTILNASSFDRGGPLARMIRADERAVTIAVDEVLTSGGHLAPDDYVDVLLYLREDDRNGDRTVQVVVPALRVLSIGSSLGLDRHGHPLRSMDEEADQIRQGRTVALAVPEHFVSRFLLAAQVGTLRLTVRSADEGLLAAYYENKPLLVDQVNRQLVAFERFAVSRQVRNPGIPVQRGSQTSLDRP